MIKVGIIGSSGYVAGELIRLLINHPEVEIDFLFSHSKAGKKASEFHEDLFHLPNLVLTDKINPDADLIFLCLGHGNSTKFLENHSFSEHTKVIDLSNDFRLEKDAQFGKMNFQYGLIEHLRPKLDQVNYVANPGCFASAIQLALLPLAKANKINSDIHVQGITGSTGAGGGLSPTSHFSWRNNNISLYKEFTHQHLGEIKETLKDLQPNFNSDINFIPMRGDFTRGILISAYTETDLSEEELVELYTSYYKNHQFVVVTTDQVNLKQVVNTNFTLLQIQKHENKVLITSAIDNLLKGAAGQAVQNMNFMFGWEEATGLKLKANFF